MSVVLIPLVGSSPASGLTTVQGCVGGCAISTVAVTPVGFYKIGSFDIDGFDQIGKYIERINSYIDQTRGIFRKITGFNKRNWHWPVSSPKKVIRDFHPPSNGQLKYLSGFHRGVDLLAKEDEPVYSPANGTVKFAGFLVNRYVISIDNGNGIVSSFEPVKAVVTKGQSVVRGQKIGEVQTGLHSGVIAGAAKKTFKRVVNSAAQLVAEYVGSVLAGPFGGKIGKEIAKFTVRSVTGEGIHVGIRKNGVYINPLLFFGNAKASVLLPAL